jgi:hypothetical protein
MQPLGQLTVGTALLMLLLADPASSAEGQRDLTPMPKVAAGTVPIDGEYWALIIGIDKYRHVPKLQSAVRDAQAVRKVLVQRYSFTRDRIIEIINDQATREGIENALHQLRKKAGKNDSLFIYYAGHGQIDQEDQIGYWVPVEGKAQSPGTFISNARVRDEIARMKAKHVYLVADSCFSGTLFGTRAMPPIDDQWFARLYKKPSRWGLTSGATEPVADKGKDGHSILTYHFIKLLRENEEPYLVPSQIHNQIARLVANNADQTPRSEPLKGAGDEGGQVVLRLAAAGPASSGPASGAEAFLEAARRKLEAEKAEMAVEHQMLKERARLEMERKQVEAERKKIEEARARPYDTPQQTGKEIVGKDGAPMVLVPAGEFMMGSTEGEADEKPVHRVALDAFYLDKYEATNKLFQKFVQETGYQTTAEREGKAFGRGSAYPPRPSGACQQV